jgi:16S rRNA (guanine1207-N2)-methyltransferase
MLSTVTFAPGERVLDLGCGWGVVGILAASIVGSENVVMTDIDARAVKVARQNAERNQVAGVTILQSDGLQDHRETDFDWILSNPAEGRRTDGDGHTATAVVPEEADEHFRRDRSARD